MRIMERRALDTLYDGWATHQRLVIDMIGGLTSDQLALRPIGALEDTWALLEGCLRRSTPEDLAVGFSRQWFSGTQAFTRS